MKDTNRLRDYILELFTVWFFIMMTLSIIPSCFKAISAFNKQVINKDDGTIRINPALLVPCDHYDRLRGTAGLRKVAEPKTVPTIII